MTKLGYLRNHLDVVASVAGAATMAVLAVALTVQHFPTIYFVAVTVGFGCIVLYLVLRERIVPQEPRAACQSDSYSLLCFALGIACVALALAFFLTRGSEHVKPTTYYASVSAGAALLFASAVLTDSRNQLYGVVAAACAIGLLHIWTESSMFPSVVGIDAWTHLRVTTQELAMAAGTAPNIYNLPTLDTTLLGSYYSLMHVLFNGAMALFPIDYKTTALIFGSSLQVVANAVLVYLIGSELLGRRVGAIASLMIGSAGWVVVYSEWVIPNSIGLTFSLAVVYALLKWRKTLRWWYWTSVLIVLAISLLWHVIVLVWVLGTIACMGAAPWLLTLRSAATRKAAHSGGVLIVLLSICAMLALWAQFSPLANSLSLSTGNGAYTPSSGLTYAIGVAPDLIVSYPAEAAITGAAAAHNQLHSSSLGELATDSSGMFLYLGLAITGCLAMLRHKARLASISLVALYLAVLAVGFIPPLLGRSLLEHRWWYLAEGIAAVPLGACLVGVCGNLKPYRIAAVAVAVGAMTFLSTIGLPSNMTNRTLSPTLIVRYALTSGEMEGLRVAESCQPKVLGSDSFYLAYALSDSRWLYSAPARTTPLDKQIITGDFKGSKADVILLRHALYKEPFAFGSGAIYLLRYNPVEAAKAQGYREVYDNGEISCLVRG